MKFVHVSGVRGVTELRDGQLVRIAGPNGDYHDLYIVLDGELHPAHRVVEVDDQDEGLES